MTSASLKIERRDPDSNRGWWICNQDDTEKTSEKNAILARGEAHLYANDVLKLAESLEKLPDGTRAAILQMVESFAASGGGRKKAKRK
jgi:hypothetical protein